MNSPHISLETLADIAEERASSQTLLAAESHVSVCKTCNATLQKLRQLIFLMRRDTAEDVPRDVLLSALRIFTPKLPVLPRIVAVLTFDSRAASPSFGMRSIRTASSRQLLYTARETDLDLRVTVENEECSLAGQVIRDGCAGAQIELSGATGTVTTEINELCEFSFPAIPLGMYSLRVRMNDVEIEIPELELKE